MPSEAKCKDVGEAKALEKEMKVRDFFFAQIALADCHATSLPSILALNSFPRSFPPQDLKGAPSTSGLRGGKKRASLGDDDDEDRPKKKFGAFLLAVQSDSD